MTEEHPEPDDAPPTTDTPEPTADSEQGTSTPDEEGVHTVDTTTDEPDTFPRDYVEKLRNEAADARVKAKDRDDLAHRLHAALTAATGRLADPSDLPFDDAHLANDDALNAAIDDLLARKPHLATRRPVGVIGQGVTSTTDTVNLAGILRSRA